MGSISYKVVSKGYTIKEAFYNAQKEAEEEYGNDIYNGKINNEFRFKDVTNLFKNSKKNLGDFIEDRLDKLSKFDLGEGICIQEPILNKNKIKSQVDHIITSGTKKWLLLYKVEPLFIECRECPKTFQTKGEAVAFARQLAEKYKANFHITMIKELDKINPLVAKVKYKKSKNEGSGKYIFYGHVSY